MDSTLSSISSYTNFWRFTIAFFLFSLHLKAHRHGSFLQFFHLINLAPRLPSNISEEAAITNLDAMLAMMSGTSTNY